MKLSRLLIVACFTLVCTGWLQADAVDPSHFFISLNINGSDCFNGIVPGTSTPCTETGQQGWGAVTGGQLQGTITNTTPVTQFGNNVSCYTNAWGHFVCHSNEPEPWDDPSAGTKLGGKSTPITTNFVVPIDSFGGGATDFQDTLGNITAIELVGFFPKSAFPLTFTCDPGTAFDACGFTFIDPPSTTEVIVDFYNLTGNLHIVGTPEPSTWFLLATALFAIAGRRGFRRA